MGDPLFSVRNSFYIGAHQKCVSEATNLTGLTEQQKIDRDVFVYRSYIELGSYEVIAGCWGLPGWVIRRPHKVACPGPWQANAVFPPVAPEPATFR